MRGEEGNRPVHSLKTKRAMSEPRAALEEFKAARRDTAEAAAEVLRALEASYAADKALREAYSKRTAALARQRAAHKKHAAAAPPERVDIQGVDKFELLREMWNHVAVHGPIPLGWNDEFARNTLAHKCFIDFFLGRRIKTDLSGDSADPRLYDRDSTMLLADIVALLRARRQ